MSTEAKKLNAVISEELAREQGALLTEIIKRAEYGSEAGLLISVHKAQALIAEAKADFPSYWKAREIAQQNNIGRPIYRKDVLEELMAMLQEYYNKWFGIPPLVPSNANQSASKKP
ncbi:MAG: hypothetical protein ACQCN3_02525 [Candidatus Bathyarchaeia archaeon]|jgi:hypothetical protein